MENLASYEVVHRRCEFLIAIDGQHDPGLNCPSLILLRRIAKVDANIDTRMDIERLLWVDFATPGAHRTGSAVLRESLAPPD